jgi:hypothetical protein
MCGIAKVLTLSTVMRERERERVRERERERKRNPTIPFSESMPTVLKTSHQVPLPKVFTILQ